MDYVGLRLGLQDPRGPPTNCGEHRVNFRYMLISISIPQQCRSCSVQQPNCSVNHTYRLHLVRGDAIRLSRIEVKRPV